MKWFQHQTDASDDIKIKRLEDKLGISGYAVYFKVLEKVAKEGQKCRLALKKYPLEFLAYDFSLKKEVLDKHLTTMNELGLIVYKSTEIYVPKLKNYVSNWTKRTYRGTTEGLRSDYGETTAKEEKRIDKIRREQNISPFLKPYYDDMLIVEQKGELFCIPVNGGKWLRFVGKVNEIQWKKS
jgi:Domain of unknown function (DUF4373)